MMMMSASSTEISASTPEVPACPACGGHYWRATQYSDCSRTVKVSQFSGRVQHSIGSWDEEGDSLENGRGGDFAQDPWYCSCGLVAGTDLGEQIDTAFEAMTR